MPIFMAIWDLRGVKVFMELSTMLEIRALALIIRQHSEDMVKGADWMRG